MWLLSTNRAELSYFEEYSSIIGGYAILSHTWGHLEQSFQDVRDIQARCKATGENPRDLVSAKIRNCCLVAENDGYAWVWIDTCCINKESSTELSEAINSMFTWYLHSEVCYAYLEDVREDDNIHEEDSEFRKAKWHTRCWTLQELLAPYLVVFLSKGWKRLGTKEGLATLLEDITDIAANYLTRDHSLVKASVAERLAWSSNRKSTRVEDEAYSLLGLFGISMPTLYGEGRRSFLRLQQEIARQSLDTTIFAWGAIYETGSDNLEPVSLKDMHDYFHGPIYDERFAFATSTNNFDGDAMYYTPEIGDPIENYLPTEDEPEDSDRRVHGPFGRLELPSFEITSHGMKCRFPVIDCGDFLIAVLLCETNDDHIGLFLHPAPRSETQDPTRRVYYTGYAFSKAGRQPISADISRLVALGRDLSNLRFRGETYQAEWRDLYIHTSPRDGEAAEPARRVVSFAPDTLAGTPFRIPRWLLGALAAVRIPLYDWDDCTPEDSDSESETESDDDDDDDEPDEGEDGDGGGVDVDDAAALPRAWVEFGDPVTCEGIRLWLAMARPEGAGPDAPAEHYAWAEPENMDNWTGGAEYWSEREPQAEDRVAGWEGMARDFGDEERTVRLSFAPCVFDPETALVLHIELRGTVYEQMQREAGLVIPPRRKALNPSAEDAIGMVRTAFVAVSTVAVCRMLGL
ncbi:HET-domain-containing protein [Epithele typhae]|uniref:HET-domain-containing protein n=1 Tax=Epithele typhae TaxID=378194 RepID=UPI002007B341|nr:HET-domain-containing protein [Epithele typhae]KAH9935233.1 HET-domain-containing protein [Epithele typhae]